MTRRVPQYGDSGQSKEQSYEDAFHLFLVPDSAGALSLADVSSDPVRLVAGAIGSKGVRFGPGRKERGVDFPAREDGMRGGERGTAL
jgi:hypothetical protein